MASEDFVGKVVSVVIAGVIVTAVAVPILTDENLIGDLDGPASVIIGILPVFMVLAILMMVIKLFMGKKN